MNAIDISGLRVRYGALEAVRGIDLNVPQGALFAFLGPNGAGKSTTLSVLSTLLAPSAGSVFVAGHALGREDDAIRRAIGIVFQQSVLDDLLTVEENLRCRGGLYGLHGRALALAVRDAAAAVGVTDLLSRRYERLSGGQRRRADIARALVAAPSLLILDEPTTGLDPQSRGAVWEAVRALQRERGMTVLLTTHYMEEAVQADAVSVICRGRIIAGGTPQALRSRYAKDALVLYPNDGEALQSVLRERNLRFETCGRALRLELSSTLCAIPLLQSLRPLLSAFEVSSGTLDDAFVHLIEGEEAKYDAAPAKA